MGKRSDKRWAKRKARRVYCQMDKIMSQLLELKDVFGEAHAEYCEVLDLIARMVLAAQDNLTTFYEAAWGKEPADWYIDT